MLLGMRKPLLAALFLAFFAAPAAAQVCGAIPALPDSERRSQYSISASTGPLNVGFQIYGDAADYANWIEVWVNGVKQAGGTYTVTSPSGSLGTLCRPITDAQVTFNAAQTGTVQIIGARRPRRASQFAENRGVTAHDLNQAISDLTAQTREAWDLVHSRTILAEPGFLFTSLPPAASRANGFLGFSSTGDLTVVSAVAPSAGVISAAMQPFVSAAGLNQALSAYLPNGIAINTDQTPASFSQVWFNRPGATNGQLLQMQYGTTTKNTVPGNVINLQTLADSGSAAGIKAFVGLSTDVRLQAGTNGTPVGAVFNATAELLNTQPTAGSGGATGMQAIAHSSVGGDVFGANEYGWCDTVACRQLIGAEIDTDNRINATGAKKGLQIADIATSTGTVTGSGFANVALHVLAQTGAYGYDYGIVIGDNASQFPLRSSGAILSTSNGTVAVAFDLAHLIFTTGRWAITPNSQYLGALAADNVTPHNLIGMNNANQIAFYDGTAMLLSSTGVLTLVNGGNFAVGAAAGQTATVTVRASGGAGDCTLIFTGGIKTGGTC